jgi:WhiB family redox-sensing transcriptional regulator
MSGYGTRPARRHCPRCGTDWTQLVDRAERQTHRTATCDDCRATPAPPTREPTVPILRLPDGAWVDQAVCASTDPEAFYPEVGASAAPAKRVCAHCPVTADCLAWALNTREPHGIWGGHTPTERRQLLRATA